MSKLTAIGVRSIKEAGRFADGNGLYLQVAPGGSKQWLLRYKVSGRERQMGLGPAGEPPGRIPLSEARRLAAEAKGMLRESIDPIDARRATKKQVQADRLRAELHTFRATAQAYIAAREKEWRNEKHRAQWSSTLKAYAFPIIGSMPVSAVDTQAILQVLTPIWDAKPETASRLRGRLESILDYARSRDLRNGENPARWRGHLAHTLPKPGKLRRVRHHAALPWKHVAAFMAALRTQPGMSARALEFAILTAARSGEALGARWQEIDLEAAAWTIPAERMKAGREHRVPLSGAVLDLLKTLQQLSRGPMSPVFPGRLPSAPLSGMALEMLIRRMNSDSGLSMQPTEPKRQPDSMSPRWSDRNDRAITPHGFRSTFRDWIGEASSFPTDLAEAALAHTVRDKTVAAYARGDLFEKRRTLMTAWALFCRQEARPHESIRDGEVSEQPNG